MSKPLMTRRDFAIAGVSLTGSLFLGGCGGLFVGSGSGGATSQVTGNITIPPGINGADLQIVSVGGVTVPTATGFTATATAGAPSFVVVMHGPTGKVIAFAMIDTQAPPYKIDATSTAEALLFMALGGNSFPTDGRKTLLDLIKASSATVTLAGVIASQLATNPYALEDANSALVSAIDTAARSFNLNRSRHVSSNASSQTDAEGLPLQLLIDPGTDVDGITVVQANNPLGFQVQNNRRRVASLYTYLVAHVDANGTRTDITPVKVGSSLDIPSTKSLLNLGQFWRPVTTATVPLTLQSGDTKSVYELVYLCPTYGTPEPTLFNFSRYAGEVGTLRKSLNDLYSAELLNVVGGIICDILGIGGLTWSITELTATITALTPVSTNFASLLIGANGGYQIIPLVQNTINAFLGEGLAGTPRVVAAMRPLLEKAEGQLAKDLIAGQANAEVYVALRAALRVMLAVGVVLILTDIGAVAKDTSTGNTGDIITATVFQPTISISPATANYLPGATINISAVVPSSGLHLKYHWKLTGSNLANLSDGTTVSSDFITDKKDITLATTPSTQGDLVVTLTVIDSTSNTNIGTVTGTYSKTNQDYLLQIVTLPPDQFHPDGSGFVAAYYPVQLSGTQATIVDVVCKVKDQGTLKYAKALPIASTPVPLTNPPTTPMTLYVDPNSVSLSNVINPQFQNNFMVYAPLPENYGNEVIVVARVVAWDARPYPGNNLMNSDQATALLKTTMQNFTVTVTPR